MEIPKAKAIILDAAEKLFAKNGYAGTSMKSIATEANVAQGLIHYHCQTKEKLYEFIVERHANLINDVRRELLAKCFAEADNGIPTLERLLETFIGPAIEHARSIHGEYYSQILATFANSNDERSQRLVHKYYDPIARDYIAAFQKVLSGLSLSEIYWGYLLATSIVVSTMARTGRIKRLSEGSFDESNTDRIIARLVRFVANGLYGLSDLSV